MQPRSGRCVSREQPYNLVAQLCDKSFGINRLFALNAFARENFTFLPVLSHSKYKANIWTQNQILEHRIKYFTAIALLVFEPVIRKNKYLLPTFASCKCFLQIKYSLNIPTFLFEFEDISDCNLLFFCNKLQSEISSSSKYIYITISIF